MFDYISDKLRLIAKILMIVAWVLSGIILFILLILAFNLKSIIIFLLGAVAATIFWFFFYIVAARLHAKATELDILSSLSSKAENIKTTVKSSYELQQEQINLIKDLNLTSKQE